MLIIVGESSVLPYLHFLFWTCRRLFRKLKISVIAIVILESVRRMKVKAVSVIMLTLLLMSMLTLAFNIQQVESEPITWTVDDDGPADFSSIQEAINAASPGDTIYVYNGIYYEQVVVNKSVSLIGEDGIATTAIITNGTEFTVYISANNVTISGFEVQNSMDGDWGIISNHSSNSIVNENIVKAVYAIRVEGGSGNNISDNEVVGPPDSCVRFGLELINSSNNVVTRNYLSMDCHTAFRMDNSSHNYIAFNYISAHFTAQLLAIVKSNNNLIVGNTIGPGVVGGIVGFVGSNGSVLYHNNFLKKESTNIWIDENSMNNTWDNGYPSGGNYWSNYTGVDLYSGPYQNETGSDGIGDTPYVVGDPPYVIDEDNPDRYPLMNPWTPDIAVMNVAPSKSIVVQGFILDINVTATNQGTTAETFNVTAYYDDTPIETKTVTNLPPGEETTITFTWNTTGVEEGDYTISAKANVIPGETATTNNTKVNGIVTVLIPGHDVAIKGVTPSKTVVGQGYSLSIHMTTKNYGNFTETFNVTAYYDDTPIETKTVTNLPPGEETTITFTWNTASVPYGNYTITANATQVPGETDTTDNTCTCWVVVTRIGDVNGDGEVNIIDILLCCINMGPVPPMPPECDVNGDGEVNIIDILLCCVNME